MQVFLTILCLTTEVELYYINTTRCGLAILKKCEHQILVRVLRYTVKSQNKLGFLVWRGRLQELQKGGLHKSQPRSPITVKLQGRRKRCVMILSDC